jgi:acyl dehydratase
MSVKQYYLWDELEIGQKFPQVEYLVKKDVIRKYVEAVQEKSEIFLSEESAKKHGFNSLIAPPTMAAVFVLEAFKSVPSPPGGVHAKQNFDFFNPVKDGDLLRTSVEIVNKYIKRNRKYVEMISETYNQRNELIVKSQMTRIWSK